MKSIQSKNQKDIDLYSESSEKLLQTTCRFRKETFEEISEIQEATGKSRAFIVRRLLRKGLEEVDF
jgi:predicted DNA-binding protein